jgi:hypothetical protein
LKTNDQVQPVGAIDVAMSETADANSAGTACSFLRFIAILQLWDFAARSIQDETHCRCQVTTEAFTWQVHCHHDSRSAFENEFSKDVPSSEGFDAEFAIEIPICRVQLECPGSMPLAYCDSSALIDVLQRSNSEADKARNRNVHHGEHGVYGEETTQWPLRFLRVLSVLRGEIRHAPMSRTTHIENERQSSGGTRRRLYPKQHGKPSAPLERLVRFCVSLRFCSSAILPLNHSWANRTAGVRLRRRDSHGKLIVITILNQHQKSFLDRRSMI